MLFYEATVILIPKPHNDTTKIENYRLVSLKNISGKILRKYWQTESKNTSEKSIHHDQEGFIKEMQGSAFCMLNYKNLSVYYTT